MNAILKILVFLTIFTGVYAQDVVERIPSSMEQIDTVVNYGPHEDEICAMCLPDGNYNLYTHLVDSVDYKPMGDWFSSMTNSVGSFFHNQSKLIIVVGFYSGWNGAETILHKTEYTEINKTITGGTGAGINIQAGILNGIQFVYRFGSVSSEQWTKNGYAKDVWGNEIEESSSSRFSSKKTSYGIRFEPNLKSRFRPYISYSIQQVQVEWEKIGEYKYLNQTYWTYVRPHQINDNFQKTLFGTELSIGASIPVYKLYCAEILADFRYTRNFIQNKSSVQSVEMKNSSTIDFGINIQF